MRHLHRTAFGAVQVSNPLFSCKCIAKNAGRLLRAEECRFRNDICIIENSYTLFPEKPYNGDLVFSGLLAGGDGCPDGVTDCHLEVVLTNFVGVLGFEPRAS